MQKFKYVLSVEVEVEAFSEDDADDLIEENFGVGSDCGVNTTRLSIISCEPE
jgi:hypothetical protein